MLAITDTIIMIAPTKVNSPGTNPNSNISNIKENIILEKVYGANLAALCIL